MLLLVASIGAFVYASVSLINISNEYGWDSNVPYMDSDGHLNKYSSIMSDLYELMKFYNENGIKLTSSVPDIDMENILEAKQNALIEKYSYQISEKTREEQLSYIEMAEPSALWEIRNAAATYQRLMGIDDVVFYINDGTNTLTNASEYSSSYFEDMTSHVTINGTNVKDSFETERNWLSYLYETDYQVNKLYIAEKNDFYEMEKAAYGKQMDQKGMLIYALPVSFFTGVIAAIYLLLTAGRRWFGDHGIRLSVIDRVPPDIMLILLLLIFAGVSLLALTAANEYSLESAELITLLSVYAALGAGLMFIIILSFARHIKNKSLLRSTAIIRALRAINTSLANTLGNKRFYLTGLLIAFGIFLLAVIMRYAPLVHILLLFILAFYVMNKLIQIKNGVDRVESGDLSTKIDMKGNGFFPKLSMSIDNMSASLERAVEERIRSERMKNEIITNVSHDIRTPLTSIITYIDLLKDETDEQKRSEYLSVLENKADRLKHLTDDLFEASKAASGAIPVELEKIDLVSLVTQGLGELADDIKKADLEFIINGKKDQCNVRADGRLMWRSVENLLSNVIKYSKEGTRVYVDFDEKDSTVELTIKNVSSNRLNISPDELMERFIRGDESRSTDGSGLGLSITDQLVSIQGGSFEIEIDGDLFKSKIKIPSF